MNTIKEQIKELKLFAKKSKDLGRLVDAKIFQEAANTIKSLSAKLGVMNRKDWISCKDELPDDNK